MTDSPTRGLSTSRATGAGARTPSTHAGPRSRAAPTRLSPPSTACAVRRRRQGPPAAARSTLPGRSLTPTPHPGAPKTGGEQQKKDQRPRTPAWRVDRTRSFRNDCQTGPASATCGNRTSAGRAVQFEPFSAPQRILTRPPAPDLLQKKRPMRAAAFIAGLDLFSASRFSDHALHAGLLRGDSYVNRANRGRGTRLGLYLYESGRRRCSHGSDPGARHRLLDRAHRPGPLDVVPAGRRASASRASTRPAPSTRPALRPPTACASCRSSQLARRAPTFLHPQVSKRRSQPATGPNGDARGGKDHLWRH